MPQAMKNGWFMSCNSFCPQAGTRTGALQVGVRVHARAGEFDTGADDDTQPALQGSQLLEFFRLLEAPRRQRGDLPQRTDTIGKHTDVAHGPGKLLLACEALCSTLARPGNRRPAEIQGRAVTSSDDL